MFYLGTSQIQIPPRSGGLPSAFLGRRTRIKPRYAKGVRSLVLPRAHDDRRDALDRSKIWTPYGTAFWRPGGWVCEGSTDAYYSDVDLSGDDLTFVFQWKKTADRGGDVWAYLLYGASYTQLSMRLEINIYRAYANIFGNSDVWSGLPAFLLDSKEHTFVWRNTKGGPSELYIDGRSKIVFNDGGTTDLGTRQLDIGGRTDSGSRSSKGMMSECAVLAQYLSPAEALEISANGFYSLFEQAPPFVPIHYEAPAETASLLADVDAAVVFGAAAESSGAISEISSGGIALTGTAACIADVLATAQAGEAIATAKVIAAQYLSAAQAGSTNEALASAVAALDSVVIATDVADAAVAANAVVASGAAAGDSPASAASALGSFSDANAQSGEALAALSQAAAAFLAGAAAGEAWTAATEAAQIAELAAGSDAGAEYLAGAQTYGAAVGATTAAASLEATASALSDFASQTTAGAAFAAVAAIAATSLSADALAAVAASALAQTSAVLQSDSIAGAVFSGLTSEAGRISLRGAITLTASLRSVVDLRAAIRGLPDIRPN